MLVVCGDGSSHHSGEGKQGRRKWAGRQSGRQDRGASFALTRGRVPPNGTRGGPIVRHGLVVEDRPGQHEGESRDAHPQLTLDSPSSRGVKVKAARRG
jgi:hypothetical protein